MNKSSEKIKNRYNRISPIYDFFEKPMEMMMSRWRKEAIGEVSGKVLEVGVGTGKNIEYYPDNVNVTAIDFSPKMLSVAKKKFDGIKNNIVFMEMDAENMNFKDNTFDTVFTSCVFCSVPDPVAGLKEIRRVCKKNGKIVMLEHVRSKGRISGFLMDIFNRIPLYLYGANINRDTVNNLKLAGFTEIHEKNLVSDILKKIIVTNSK